MKRIRLLFLFTALAASGILSAQNLTIASMEYFFDNDPGFGQGTSVSFTSGQEVSFTQSLNTSGLSTGFHNLYLRAVTDNGVWGPYETKSVYVNSLAVVNSVVEIEKLEYFFDTDPGAGNGTAISNTLGEEVNLNEVLATDGLSTGFHNLYLRGKLTDGAWGPYETKFLYINSQAVVNSVVEVEKLEYFFDTDPGQGNGIAISNTLGEDVNLNDVLATSGLTSGFHNLYLRGKLLNGAWGPYETKFLYVNSQAVVNSVVEIEKLEYFFDTDPGQGNGVAINNTLGDQVNLSNLLTTDGLSSGFHNLYLRGKLLNGTWGPYETKTVYVQQQTNLTLLVSQVEYFFDTDPGLGLAERITFSSAEELSTSIQVLTSTQAIGNHRLYLRAAGEDGFFGPYEILDFTIVDGIVSEDFETGLPAVTGTGDYVLASGTWSGVSISQETTNLNGGQFAARLLTQNASIITPELPGVASISFFYALPAAGSQNFKVLESIDGGAFVEVQSLTATTTAYNQFTTTLNHFGSFVKLKIETDLTAGSTQDLLIDDFLATSIQPLEITNFYPRRLGTDVALDSVFAFTFTQEVLKGTGNLYIIDTSDSSIFQTIPVSSLNLSVDSVNFSHNVLLPGKEYAITMDPGLFSNVNSTLSYHGILDNNTWVFSTVSPLIPPVNFYVYRDQSNQIVMSWIDAESNETGYRVEYSSDYVNWGNYSGNLAANSQSYIASVGQGTGYWWRVVVFNGTTSSVTQPRYSGNFLAPGLALSLDGVDDYVELTDSPAFDFGTGDFTAETWFRTKNISASQSLINSYNGNAGAFFALFIEAGQVRAALSNGVYEISSATTLQNDQWHHAALVRRQDTAFMYVDGALQASILGQSARNVTSSGLINLGRQASTNNIYLNGDLDETRIWNVARSAAQIASTYNAAMTGNEPGLVAYYSFDLSVSTTYIPDLGVNNLIGSWKGNVSGVTTPQLIASTAFTPTDPTLQLTSPNGGEVWSLGTQQVISWTRANTPDTDQVEIRLSRNGGTSYNVLQSGTFGDFVSNQYLWTVNGPGTSEAIIKVINTTNPLQDSSNAVFTIYDAPPQFIGAPSVAFSGNTFELKYTLDELATVYLVALTDGNGLPNASQIKEGATMTNPLTGQLAQLVGDYTTPSVQTSATSSGIFSINQIFDFYLVAEDTAGNLNAGYGLPNVLRSCYQLECDSINLLAIYNAMGGANWVAEKDWNTTAISTWDSVSIQNNRVVGVSLANNGLKGTLPTNVVLLDSLKSLSLPGNTIDNIPSLVTLSKLNYLNLKNNRLQFDDLEPNVGIQGIVYSPQAKLSEPVAANLPKNSSYQQVISVGGSQNTWSWTLTNDSLATIPVTMEGGFLFVPDLNYATMGTYQMSVTSALVPNLILESSPIKILATSKLEFLALGKENQTLTTGAGYALKIIGKGIPFDSIPKIEISGGKLVWNELVLGDYLIAAEGDLAQYLPTYYKNTYLWEQADTLRLRGDQSGDLQMTIIPEPLGPDDGDNQILGSVESDFADEEGGRISARRKVTKAGCSVRRLKGSGRTGADDDQYELIAYIQTNDEGRFVFDYLPDGIYRFNIEYPGIPMDPNSFVEFEIGAGVDGSKLVLEAYVTENGIEVLKIDQLGFFKKYFTELNVYPNPAVDQLFISYEKLNTPDIIAKLIDLQGRVVKEQTLIYGSLGEVLTLDVNDLANGMYLLHFVDPNRPTSSVVAYKVLIQH